MNNMENKAIQEVLADIQRILKVAKNQRNTFGNYNYRSCEDILEAVKPLLHGCTLVISDEIVCVGARYYVRAKATISNKTTGIHAYGYARESEEKKGMDSAQITGAASSYARKYALNGLFAIDDTKDADTTDNRAETKAKTPNSYIKPRIIPGNGSINCESCHAPTGKPHATTCAIANS